MHPGDVRHAVPKSFLTNPNPATIQDILRYFLNELGVENIHVPDLRATQNIPNLERYENMLKLGNLSACVSNLLATCGFNDFSTSDLLAPKRRKTVRILSILIGLWYKHVAVGEKWKEFSADCELQEQQKKDLEQKNQQLQRDCEKKLLYLQEHRINSEKTREKLLSLHATLEQRKKDSEAINAEYRGYKLDMAKETSALSQLELKIKQEKEEISHLESKIVRSPEKVLAETKSKEADLDSRRQEKTKQQKEYMEAMKQLDKVQGASLELKPTTETLKETFDGLNLLRDKCASIADMKDKLKVKHHKMQQMDVVCGQTETNLRSLEDQQRRAKIQFNMKIKPLADMNDGIKSEIDKKKESCSGTSKTQQVLLEKERVLVQTLDQIKNSRNNFSTRLASCLQESKAAVNGFRSEANKHPL